MKCGYFTCSKNALLSLNILYILISILVIGVAVYVKAVSLVSSYTIIGTAIGCGVFLLFLACMGFIGAVKHHQICLFFYMVILFLLFLVQFSLAIALLAVSTEGQKTLIERGWNSSSAKTKIDVMTVGSCCGLTHWQDAPQSCPSTLECCQGDIDSRYECCGGQSNNMISGCRCETCFDDLKEYLNIGYKVTGAIGLFISITEIIGVWLAARFRNQKDPTADPNAFL
ncbi:tetraspanin-13-like [Watersipora subatra]|uniref:tetraspanin-13-like n=1 Tax=Watersipora subatra TaxID=2589382 RepID=UPI00355B881D